MRRRPPRSTRTDTLLPYTTRCRSQVHARVMREVIEPTVRGMAADGVPFSGFLYAGLMIDAQGTPRVIEFNVRFGDPETQPILRSEEHTSELQSLMRISYAVFCLKKKINNI